MGVMWHVRKNRISCGVLVGKPKENKTKDHTEDLHVNESVSKRIFKK
jgi:hypothetical protein